MTARSLMSLVLGFFVTLSMVSCGNPPIPPLVRGPRWISFRGPTVPLLSNRVNDIVAHRNSQVWIATDSGAAYFERGSWGVIDDSLKYLIYTNSYPESYVSSKVNCLTVGRDGSIWFGLAGGGVRRYIQGDGLGRPWIRYTSPTISFNVISSLAAEDVVNGDIWAATLAAGVNRFLPSPSDPREGSWRHYTVSDVPDFGTNSIRVAEVNRGTYSVWIASQLSLVAWFGDLSGWRRFDIPPPYDDPIQSMAFDQYGRVWLGKTEGISRYDLATGVWSHFTHDNTQTILPRGQITAVLTDYEGHHYFGTTKGLAIYDGTNWSVLRRDSIPALPSDSITALSADRHGNLWIGTADGVAVFNAQGTLLR